MFLVYFYREYVLNNFKHRSSIIYKQSYNNDWLYTLNAYLTKYIKFM